MPHTEHHSRSDRVQHSRRREGRQYSWLTGQPFAHRGLHDDTGGVPENSLAAFAQAIAVGHGIELDVQMSLDGVAIVFHDDDLRRLTGMEGRLRNLPSARLRGLSLNGTAEHIPTLDAALALVAGRVPILIEIKCSGKSYHGICFAVRRALEGYRGAVAVMSFNTDVIRWFARNVERLPRGVIITDEHPPTLFGGLRRWLRDRKILRMRLDFAAYDVRSLPSSLSRRLRQRRVPVLTWTVRTPDDIERAQHYADNAIYERPSEPVNL